ncbi:1140_t:CDS:2, partial [Entrophospora sp. SA101]
LNNCFSSPDNNNSNDNTEIDYEIIQINENNCTQAESNKMVPAFIQQKFLQIIASSNDEVNEQSKKINSSKRVLDLEIASGLQPRITSQFQKYNISQGQSNLLLTLMKVGYPKIICKAKREGDVDVDDLEGDLYRSNGMVPVVFHSVIRTALEVWKNLGGGDKSAQYTLAIVPHSASCECLFSVLSWFTQKCRNRLDVEKVSNMAKLHSFYTMNANSELNYITQEMSEEQLINALHDYGNGLFSGEGERENFNRPLEDIEDYGDPDYNIDVIRDSGI